MNLSTIRHMYNISDQYSKLINDEMIVCASRKLHKIIDSLSNHVIPDKEYYVGGRKLVVKGQNHNIIWSDEFMHTSCDDRSWGCNSLQIPIKVQNIGKFEFESHTAFLYDKPIDFNHTRRVSDVIDKTINFNHVRHLSDVIDSYIHKMKFK